MKKKIFYLKLILTLLIFFCAFNLFQTIKENHISNKTEYEQNLHLDFPEYFNFTKIPNNLLPTWIPEEYELYDYYDLETDRIKMVDAAFCSEVEDHYMSITVTYLYDDIQFNYEKDDSPVEIIEKDGINYFIMGNLDTNTFVWRNGPFECQVDGTVSREVLKQMIDSIPSK